MSLSLLFWILMLFWAVFGFWREYRPAEPFPRYGNSILVFVLLVVLGWALFGSPVNADNRSPVYQPRSQVR